MKFEIGDLLYSRSNYNDIRTGFISGYDEKSEMVSITWCDVAGKLVRETWDKKILQRHMKEGYCRHYSPTAKKENDED